MATITAHCIVKNEEVFLEPAIRSVIDFVDKMIVFDTGSTDQTASIIQRLAAAYPDKILFEEKGVCDKVRHTVLRQEMVERTATDWFMILDGDEVWTKRAMKEALEAIDQADGRIDCLVSPFYLCVGDVYHETRQSGKINILGRSGYHYPRFCRCQNIRWQGDYNEDTLLNTQTGKVFFDEGNTVFLREKYWHLTHLRRSSLDDNVYSSGDSRAAKRRLTYFVIGKRIAAAPPEVFDGFDRLPITEAIKNFFSLLSQRLCRK